MALGIVSKKKKRARRDDGMSSIAYTFARGRRRLGADADPLKARSTVRHYLNYAALFAKGGLCNSASEHLKYARKELKYLKPGKATTAFRKTIASMEKRLKSCKR